MTNDRIIKLNGKVVPPTSSLIYDFTSDQARTTSSTPPATDITIGTGSSARAGVVSYTDNNNSTSNMLKVYNGGSNSNGTGVMNLDKFEDESTDYSVTWKQYILSSTDSYKNGVVLRGDKDNVGNSSKGYAPGLMTGYVFIAYNNTSAGNTEFRIYTSTESTNLNMKSNNTANIKASVGDPIWYRASVEGVSPTILKLEYSLDNNNWNTVSSYTETNATFKKGSTQFVWGLAAARSGFNLDDIKFDGISYSENMISSIDQITSDNSDIVSTEYFTIMGERVIPGKEELKGFFIVRYHMSDGQTKSEKIYLK